MRSKMLVFVLLMISAASPLIDYSSAQTVTASVELTCTSPYPSGAIDVEVHPGATLTGYSMCTVSNPTIHNEKISIQVQADGLAVAAPGTITLGPGQEADFQVTVRADSRMQMSSRSLTTTAQVTEMSGVPPPNIAESTVNQIINILQFSMLSVEAVEPYLEVYTGEKINLEYKVYNQGNWVDKFLLSTDYNENLDFQISVPLVAAEIDFMTAPYKFQINLAAPSDGSEWQLNSDGVRTLATEIYVEISSEFSCRYEGVCNTVTVKQSIVFLHNETVEEEPESNALSSSTDDQMLIYGGGGGGILLLLILFVVMRKKK